MNLSSTISLRSNSNNDREIKLGSTAKEFLSTKSYDFVAQVSEDILKYVNEWKNFLNKPNKLPIRRRYVVSGHKKEGVKFEWLTVSIVGGLLPIRNYRPGTKKKIYTMECTVMFNYEICCDLFECGSRCSSSMCYSEYHLCNEISLSRRFVGTKRIHESSKRVYVNTLISELVDFIADFDTYHVLEGDNMVPAGMNTDKVNLSNATRELFAYIGEGNEGVDTRIKRPDECIVCYQITERRTTCCRNRLCLSCAVSIPNCLCPYCRDSGPVLMLECKCDDVCKSVMCIVHPEGPRTIV